MKQPDPPLTPEQAAAIAQIRMDAYESDPAYRAFIDAKVAAELQKKETAA